MKVDMSPQAIEGRLKQASDLRDLCVWLGKAKRTRKVVNADAEEVSDEQRPEQTATKPE